MSRRVTQKEIPTPKRKLFRRKYDPEKTRRFGITYRYGITYEEYEKILAEQAGLCAICGKPDGEKLVIDHSHLTGQVRGLLCYACNYGLGLWADDQERLLRAAIYLHRASQEWATKGLS